MRVGQGRYIRTQTSRGESHALASEVEKGKFADVIAVSGNPLTDITEMERVKFVMKGGLVVRNDLNRETENGR